MFATSALALDAGRDLHQYKHRRWTIEDGAPPSIYGIAQTRDGYLWLGAGTGLYRFDGVTFEAIPSIPGDRTRSRQVTALLATRSGDLWVGYRAGGVALYRNRRLTPITIPDQAGTIIKIVEGPDGTIWALSNRTDGRSLSRYRNGTWMEVGAREGFMPQTVGSIAIGGDGSLWVAGNMATQRLVPGASRFATIERGLSRSNRGLAADRAGRLWLLDNAGLTLLTKEGSSPQPTPRRFEAFSVSGHLLPKLILDADGSIWATDQESGIARLRLARNGPQSPALSDPQRYGARDGLTSDSVNALFEGREGEIWAGTAGGLDRFTATDIVRDPVFAPDGTAGGLASPDGSVYFAGYKNLYRALPGQRPVRLTDGLNYAVSRCAGSDGAVWIMTEDWWIRWRDGRLDRYPRPSTNRTYSSYECLAEGTERLLVAGGMAGLLRFDHGAWEQLPLDNVNTQADWVVRVRKDPQGRILLGVRNKGLMRVEGRRAILVWDAAEIGRVNALGPVRETVLVGGNHGLARVGAAGVRVLDSDKYPWLVDVGGIAETRNTIWLVSAAGLVRVARADLEAAFSRPGTPIPHRVFGPLDGLLNLDFSGNMEPVVIGGDGRLWITTADGVSWLDPEHPVRNPLAPPVNLRALIAAGRRYIDPAGSVALPRGTAQVELDFTANSLLIPERVRFRYRLEGVDETWVDAGSRRSAFYTNLGPGTYRFQVIAANNDGVWNRDGATLEFTIPPTFLQSVWFKLLIALAVAALAALAYRFRIRHVTARMQAQFNVRIAERERIARELHDTLLQGFQGLMLRFQVVADRVPKQDGVQKDLEDALDCAETVLVDGRARVRDLRGPSAERELADALRHAGSPIGGAAAPPVTVIVEGMPRPLHPLVREEALAIGEEAIRNATRHARASRIDVHLHYGSRDFSLTVKDDGIGLPEAVRSTGERDGHFGLIGMRERAARIDGRLDITGKPGAGTMVTLTLSKRAAYAGHRHWFWGWL